MATTKKTEVTVEEKAVESIPVGERKVTIMLPRLADKSADQDVFVSVNNKDYLIKRGYQVEVPVSVAEVIRHSEEMQNYAYEFENQLERNRKNKEY